MKTVKQSFPVSITEPDVIQMYTHHSVLNTWKSYLDEELESHGDEVTELRGMFRTVVA